MDLAQVALRRKRRDEAALGAFERDPVRITDVARLIAKFDRQTSDGDYSDYKRIRQRFIDAIKRGELPTDAARKFVSHQALCRWACRTWHDKPWFLQLRNARGFELYSAVGTSDASLPGPLGQGSAFQWVDDYTWLREHYPASEAGRLKLLAETNEQKRWIDELEREVQGWRVEHQALRDQNRDNRLGEGKIKKRR